MPAGVLGFAVAAGGRPACYPNGPCSVRRSARRTRRGLGGVSAWLTSRSLLEVLAHLRWATGGASAVYFILLWLVPLISSFMFFMFLRDVYQHSNADDGRLTNSRVFFADPFTRWAVFVYGQDMHIPHHLFPAIPHYRLRDLHGLLKQDHRPTAAGGRDPRTFHDPAGRPTILDEMTPASRGWQPCGCLPDRRGPMIELETRIRPASRRTRCRRVAVAIDAARRGRARHGSSPRTIGKGAATCRNRSSGGPESGPLAGLDEWEEFLQERYPEPREKSSFRDYGDNVRPAVREFYRLNHRHQTLDFVRAKERQYLRQDPADDGDLGGDGVPQHAGRRQRPRHRTHPDRAPDADGRGDPRRRPSRAGSSWPG